MPLLCVRVNTVLCFYLFIIIIYSILNTKVGLFTLRLSTFLLFCSTFIISNISLCAVCTMLTINRIFVFVYHSKFTHAC